MDISAKETRAKCYLQQPSGVSFGSKVDFVDLGRVDEGVVVNDPQQFLLDCDEHIDDKVCQYLIDGTVSRWTITPDNLADTLHKWRSGSLTLQFAARRKLIPLFTNVLYKKPTKSDVDCDFLRWHEISLKTQDRTRVHQYYKEAALNIRIEDDVELHPIITWKYPVFHLSSTYPQIFQDISIVFSPRPGIETDFSVCEHCQPVRGVADTCCVHDCLDTCNSCINAESRHSKRARHHVKHITEGVILSSLNHFDPRLVQRSAEKRLVSSVNKWSVVNTLPDQNRWTVSDEWVNLSRVTPAVIDKVLVRVTSRHFSVLLNPKSQFRISLEEPNCYPNYRCHKLIDCEEICKRDELKTNKNLRKLLPICFPTAGSLADLEIAYILDREDPDVWELP